MEKSLPEMYQSHAAACLDTNGVYPHIMMALGDDDKLTVSAMDLKPQQVLDNMLKVLATERPKELMYSFDRFCKPGQAKYSDCLAGAYWNGEGWKPFILEYADGKMEPINWDNAHWNEAVKSELLSYMDSKLGEKT